MSKIPTSEQLEVWVSLFRLTYSPQMPCPQLVELLASLTEGHHGHGKATNILLDEIRTQGLLEYYEHNYFLNDAMRERFPELKPPPRIYRIRPWLKWAKRQHHTGRRSYLRTQFTCRLHPDVTIQRCRRCHTPRCEKCALSQRCGCCRRLFQPSYR